MVTLSENKSTNPAAFRVKTKLGGALRIILLCTAGDLVTGSTALILNIRNKRESYQMGSFLRIPILSIP
jgi:hypothetical protein